MANAPACSDLMPTCALRPGSTWSWPSRLWPNDVHSRIASFFFIRRLRRLASLAPARREHVLEGCLCVLERTSPVAVRRLLYRASTGRRRQHDAELLVSTRCRVAYLTKCQRYTYESLEKWPRLPQVRRRQQPFDRSPERWRRATGPTSGSRRGSSSRVGTGGSGKRR